MTLSIVTGSNGFIGSHLVDELVNRGEQVICFDKQFDNLAHHTTSQVHKIYCDVTKSDIRIPKVDCIYHLAALSNIIPSISNPRDYYETNVTGTFNMLEAAQLAGVKKFVYAASASCYGISYPMKDGNFIARSEDDECFPAYPYALTKYLGEQLVMHYGKVYGMEVVSLRIFNCYGNRSLTKNAYGAMFNTFMAQKCQGKPFTVIGDGTQSRDFVYVDDVVEAFVLAAQKGTGIYNCGTGSPTSINRICEIIGGPVVNIPDRAGEPHCIYADNGKLRSLGWEPKTTIEAGIALMTHNLGYWKDAVVFSPEMIEKEVSEWQKHLA